MDWVRLYHDMPTDPKWRVIAKKSGQRIGDVIAVFNFVLVNASANGADRGRLSNLSNEDVGAALDLDEQDVKAILAAMEGRVIAVDRLIAERGRPICSPLRPAAEVWAKIRMAIFERDDWTCGYCGKRGVALECDHIVPVSRGGPSDHKNLVTACKACNRSKRDLTPEEWGLRNA